MSPANIILISGASLVPFLYVRHLQKIKGSVFWVTHIESTCTALAFSPPLLSFAICQLLNNTAILSFVKRKHLNLSRRVLEILGTGLLERKADISGRSHYFLCVCLEGGRLTDDMTGEGQQEHSVEYAERICEGQVYYTVWKKRPSKPEKQEKAQMN